jgi:putative ABC transport system permease protein
MASLARDLRYALRMLRRSPGYTSIAILTLAISIGANTAIFSFVDGVLLKPLPYRDADRIVRVMEKPPQGERNGISTLNFLDWQRDNTVFDFLAAQTGGGATLTGVTEPVQLRGGRVSADFFRIFGIEPALGRTFAHDEDQPGKHRVVILSYALWVSQFGSDPGIVNRQILLDDQPHTVIGVLPRGGAFDRAFNQIWRPLAFEPSNMTRDFHWLVSYGRVKDGVSIEQAASVLPRISRPPTKDGASSLNATRTR